MDSSALNAVGIIVLSIAVVLASGFLQPRAAEVTDKDPDDHADDS